MGAGAVLEEDAAEEVLPAAGLVTASPEYYPTVAINALMRTLRDSAMAPHHADVVRALFSIFQALGLSSVPYLPKVVPLVCHLPPAELGLRPSVRLRCYTKHSTAVHAAEMDVSVDTTIVVTKSMLLSGLQLAGRSSNTIVVFLI